MSSKAHDRRRLRHALIQLVPVTPAGREHGALTAFFIMELSSFVRPRNGRRGFVTGVPDLAVEIVSFDTTVAEVAVKAADYELD